MSDFTDYHVTEAMVVYGGSFARGLGQLYRLADEDNRRRLAQAFPEYFAKYRDLALWTKTRAAQRAPETPG